MAKTPRQEQQAQDDAERHAQADRQQRKTRTRAILQQVKLLVVDLHIPVPPVPATAIAAAKVAIEQQMIHLPILELPLSELQQIGTGIRDKIYATYRTAAVSVPAPPINTITPVPSPAQPKEAAMPIHRVLSGYYFCPKCLDEFELERVPEREAVCQDCRVALETDEDDD